MTRSEFDVAIIGAGPAGLTAGHELARQGRRVLIVERDPVYVGGIARTVAHRGLLFDIGGHRFFSKSERVERFWTEILGEDLIVRRRSSRIYYRRRFFSYPLQPMEALLKLGPIEAARCVLSFLRARARPIRAPRSFEDWVVNQFGRRLFTIFFKTYTEKVWGMPCREISADWAAQRIRGLSLWAALRTALIPRPSGARSGIKSLIESFRYPRRGPGMMWEAVARRFVDAGGELAMGTEVRALRPGDGWTLELATPDGPRTVRATHVLSSMPIRELGERLAEHLSEPARAATQAFAYRDFLIVVLAFRGPELFEDHWIYVHDPGVRVGRIQNFRRWSPDMVSDPEVHSYGLEYFCFEGDGLWTSSDERLVDLGRAELARMGMGAGLELVDSCVVRQSKAYPVYDLGYRERVATVRAELARWPTLQLIGRNGMHKYNNQDHAMMTGFLAAENVLRGEPAFDLWRVNVDAEYLEESNGASGERRVPEARG